ncbi:MAG: hypothetical protein ACI9R3_000907, partial [Verrucomicrobiales bacterium]
SKFHAADCSGLASILNHLLSLFTFPWEEKSSASRSTEDAASKFYQRSESDEFSWPSLQ